MHDPSEGVDPGGFIVTGVGRDRVPARFEPVLAAASTRVAQAGEDIALYLYGSVATGTARSPESDVDLFAVGLPEATADVMREELSARYRHLCRSVEVGAARRADYAGESDAAYGNRVFLRHYSVHVMGPDLQSGLPAYRADAAAARGFNGDIALRAADWREAVAGPGTSRRLARSIGSKSLFAVAGLVSIADGTWTTDRRRAAMRWAGGRRLGWSAGS